MAGGFIGYGLIIATAVLFQWNQTSFYVYYVFGVRASRGPVPT